MQTPLNMENKSWFPSLQSLIPFALRPRVQSVREVAWALLHATALLLCTIQSCFLHQESANRLSFHQWNLYTAVELLHHLHPVKNIDVWCDYKQILTTYLIIVSILLCLFTQEVQSYKGLLTTASGLPMNTGAAQYMWSSENCQVSPEVTSNFITWGKHNSLIIHT